MTIKPEQNSLIEKHEFLHKLLLSFQCEEGSIVDLCCHPVSVSLLTASRLQLQTHSVCTYNTSSFSLSLALNFSHNKQLIVTSIQDIYDSRKCLTSV